MFRQFTLAILRSLQRPIFKPTCLRKFLPFASTVALLQCALIDSELAAEAVKGQWFDLGKQEVQACFFEGCTILHIFIIYVRSFF